MTITTATFQKNPDYYDSAEQCLQQSRKKEQTNPRYKNFLQTHFTAGDEEQFQQYRNSVNYSVCPPEIILENNIFGKFSDDIFAKYSNLDADAVINTFRYIFFKFKKGIFVKIADNELKVFLPFSNANFINEWSDKIKIESKYFNVINFFRYIANMEGRNFNHKRVNTNIDEWYGNSCLVRYEYPINEGDSNVGNVKNMLEELCATRKVPDIEFFINRRDFPILTKDGTEPYNNLWGSKNIPLVSHLYEKYVPILSMSKSDRYADILIPTWEDWARVQNCEGKWFPKSCRNYSEEFATPWRDKIPTAVFRGGSTGCGVTIDTNQRLKLAYLSTKMEKDENGIPYLDAGITNWNLRPRKLENEEYLRTIDIKNLPIKLVDKMTLEEQSKYKYIVNVEGHVSAFRLSMELCMGSVILLAESEWKIWYSKLLKPYIHYVPVKKDLSDLIDQIKWCRKNDSKCETIAQNATIFFNTYLQRKGIFDYVQKTLVDLKRQMGTYLYNAKSPLEVMLETELKQLENNYFFPDTDRNVNNLNSVPPMARCYGILQGVEWAVKKVIADGNADEIFSSRQHLFANKSGDVNYLNFANFPIVMKSTSDSNKIKEHFHEAFIGNFEINKLSKVVPNFGYILGIFPKEGNVNVITEYIEGQTLCEYINSDEFSFEEFLFIIIQVCLAIQVAQNTCGFVHYDLTPWNIVLQKLSYNISFDYILSHDNIVRVNTSIIPIIIDFGKSHVVHEGVHHGFVNMFKASTVQDILTLLSTSIYQILRTKRLEPKDFNNLIIFANFISGTKYCPVKFNNAQTMKNFFRKSRKYAELIFSEKYDLEKYVPYDLVKYILENTKNKYNFPVEVVKDYKNSMNRGNGRQVFEYIFSNTTEQRLSTYTNVFSRLKHCTLPQPKNIFFVYYASQNFSDNLSSVKENMLVFLRQENINPEPYIKIFNDTEKLLSKLYLKKILEQKNDKKMDYTISGSFDKLIQANYTEETFLNPKKILKMNDAIQRNQDADISYLKEVVETVLLNGGKYKMSEYHKKFYINNFSRLLDTNSFNMKNNTANRKTFLILQNIIYTEDKKELEKKLAGEKDKKCDVANEYLKLYKQLSEINII